MHIYCNYFEDNQFCMWRRKNECTHCYYYSLWMLPSSSQLWAANYIPSKLQKSIKTTLAHSAWILDLILFFSPLVVILQNFSCLFLSSDVALSPEGSSTWEIWKANCQNCQLVTLHWSQVRRIDWRIIREGGATQCFLLAVFTL